MAHSLIPLWGGTLIIGFFCLAGCNKASQSTSPQRENASDWALEASDSKELGAPIKLSGFEIRPPASFRFIMTPDAKLPAYLWAGPVRKDETYGTLAISIMELSDKQAKTALENLFVDPVTAIKRKHDNCTNTGTERGTINGHPFVRTSWTGIANSSAREGLRGREFHGVAYLGLYGRRAVQILYQDVAPDHADSLKVGELATATFRESPSIAGAP